MTDLRKAAEMALEAGGYIAELPNGDAWLFDNNQNIEQFFSIAFAAGATAEREACAQMVDHILKEGGGTYGDVIRARGEK